MSYLENINENNNYNEEDKVPLLIEKQRVGQVRKKYLTYFLESEIFVLKNEKLTLLETLKTFEERTEVAMSL